MIAPMIRRNTTTSEHEEVDAMSDPTPCTKCGNRPWECTCGIRKEHKTDSTTNPFRSTHHVPEARYMGAAHAPEN